MGGGSKCLKDRRHKTQEEGGNHQGVMLEENFTTLWAVGRNLGRSRESPGQAKKVSRQAPSDFGLP